MIRIAERHARVWVPEVKRCGSLRRSHGPMPQCLLMSSSSRRVQGRARSISSTSMRRQYFGASCRKTLHCCSCRRPVCHVRALRYRRRSARVTLVPVPTQNSRPPRTSHVPCEARTAATCSRGWWADLTRVLWFSGIEGPPLRPLTSSATARCARSRRCIGHALAAARAQCPRVHADSTIAHLEIFGEGL